MGLGKSLQNIAGVLAGKGYLHDPSAERQDIWIGSLPTILPDDTNPNPIQVRTNENGL